jgi:YEATS domain-containing protein 1/3
MVLILGHDAKFRTEPTKEGFTHDWCCWVRGETNTDPSKFIEKVVFHLHSSFPKPKRVVKSPPFEVQESGFGSFDMVIDVYFKNKDEPRMVRYTYDLILPTPEQQTLHAPRHEMLTFQNPPLEFCQKLVLAGGTVKSGPDLKQILSTIPPSSGSGNASKKTKRSTESDGKTKQKQSNSDEPAPKKIKREDETETGRSQSTSVAVKQEKEKASGASMDQKRRQLSGKDPVSALIAEYASDGDSSDSDLDFGSFKSKNSTPSKMPKQATTPVKGGISGNSSDMKRKSSDDVKMKKKEKEETGLSQMPSTPRSRRSTGKEIPSEKKTPEATGEKSKREMKQKPVQKEKRVSTKTEKEGGVKEKEERNRSKDKPSEIVNTVKRRESKRRSISPMKQATDGETKKTKEDSKPDTKVTDSPSNSDSNESDEEGKKQNGHEEESKTQTKETAPPSRLPSADLLLLHRYLNSLQDKTLLQKIVDLVETTGKYTVNEKTFDFDLLQMDNSMLLQLKNLMPNQS